MSTVSARRPACSGDPRRDRTAPRRADGCTADSRDVTAAALSDVVAAMAAAIDADPGIGTYEFRYHTNFPRDGSVRYPLGAYERLAALGYWQRREPLHNGKRCWWPPPAKLARWLQTLSVDDPIRDRAIAALLDIDGQLSRQWDDFQ